MATGDRTAEPVSTRELVADVWSELLGRRPVAEDSFFALGGNSLLAARATARTRKAAGVRLELTLLLEHPVFADYVARVDLVSRAEETA